MYSKKGKRKIIVNGKVYYWCVTLDKDMGIEPVTLRVFSENEYLFGVEFEYKNKEWLRIREPNPLNAHSLILGEATQITPFVVREQILCTKTLMD